MVKSALDDIQGIGPRRRDVIWKHFSSIDELKQSSFEKIQKRTKFSKQIIIKIINALNKDD